MAALWTAIVTAGEMTVTDLFTVRTYAEEIYTRQATRHGPGDAPLAALPGMIVIALAVAAGLLLCVKLRRATGRPACGDRDLCAGPAPNGRTALCRRRILMLAAVPWATCSTRRA